MTLLADDMATKFCFGLWQVLEESIAQVIISFVERLRANGEEHSVLVYERQPERLPFPSFLYSCPWGHQWYPVVFILFPGPLELVQN
jgi:hypothetical protein